MPYPLLTLPALLRQAKQLLEPEFAEFGPLERMHMVGDKRLAFVTYLQRTRQAPPSPTKPGHCTFRGCGRMPVLPEHR